MAFMRRESLDNDFQLALRLHKEINGPVADEALQFQRQRDFKAPVATPAFQPQVLQRNWIIHTPVPPVRKRYPWQIPPRDPLVAQEILAARSSSASTSAASTSTAQNHVFNGRVLKPIKSEKEKFKRAAQLHVDGSGPSNSVPPPLANLNPIPSVIGQHPALLQLIPVAKRTSPDDFYLPALKTFVKAELTDWVFVNIEPQILNIFQTIQQRFFRAVSKVYAYGISWSDDFTDATNFTIHPVSRNIQLNRKTLLKCSRANFFSVLFHAMIHCSVYETSYSRKKEIYEHDANFMAIMKYFNEQLHLEIGTDHTFLRSADEDLAMYQCQGACSVSNMSVFAGIIKCQDEAVVPTIHDLCVGRFHRIFEITRTLNNNIETRHVVHERFSDPKAADNAEMHPTANIKPRQIVDMTGDDEAAAGPTVVEMTQVIDLDEAEFAVNRNKTRKIVELLKGQLPGNFATCPLCKLQLEELGGFRTHIDLCLGFELK